MAMEVQDEVLVVDEEWMQQPPYRFVRCNPRWDVDETLSQLRIEIGQHPYPILVPWIQFHFYAIPNSFALHKSKCFHSGRIYGQDVSSGAAVAVLMTNQYDDDDDHIDHDRDNSFQQQSNHTIRNPAASLRILDLCCSPGLKLCAMADLLLNALDENSDGKLQPQHTLIGVDISPSRMSLCKRIVHKYQISSCNTNNTNDNADTISTQQQQPKQKSTFTNHVRIRLYCNDGTTFATIPRTERNIVFDSIVAQEEEISRRTTQRQRINKSARARLKKQYKDLIISDENMISNLSSMRYYTSESDIDKMKGLLLFDRVLVDAECSTDGSVIHVQKRKWKQSCNKTTSAWSMTDPKAMSELVELQKKLAASGFRLLQQGGVMVYSTCSLCPEQNEDVVQWLLHEFHDARLVPVDFTGILNKEGMSKNFIKSGSIAGTVRFLPNLVPQNSHRIPDSKQLFGGGFFLAKILKCSTKK